MVEINLDNGPVLLMKSPVAFTDKVPLSFNTVRIGELTASEKEPYSILSEESTIIRETIKLEKINSIYMDEHFGPLLDKQYHSDLDEWLFKFKLNPETFKCFKFEEKHCTSLKFSPIVFKDKLIPRTIAHAAVSPCLQYLYSNSFVSSKNSIERIDKDISRIESYKRESLKTSIEFMRTELCNEYKRKISTIDDIEVLKSMKSH